MTSPINNLDSPKTSEAPRKETLLEAQLSSIAQRVKSGSPAAQAAAKRELETLRKRPEFQDQTSQRMMDQADQGQEPRQETLSGSKSQASGQAPDSGPSLDQLGRFQSSEQPLDWQSKSGFFSRNPSGDLAAKTQSRDPGRDAGRTQTSPGNANQWSVANSSKASPQVRQFLNDTNPASKPSDFLLNTISFRAADGSTNPGQPWGLSSGFGPQSQGGTDGLSHLFRQVFNSSGGETAARAFTGHGFEGGPLLKAFQAFQNLTPEQLVAKQLSQQNPVVIDVRNNFVFVKTKDGFHALKLEDDILHELPLTDESGKPLGPEEKKMILKLLKEKGIDAKFAGDEEILGMLGESELAAGFEKFLQQKKGVSGKISKEDMFCLLLDAVLKGKLKIGAGLEGDPLFPTKEDWLAFFANLGGLLGNKPLSLSKPIEEILSLLFRGLFSKDGKHILVGDLKYLAEGETLEAKMIQAELSEEALEMLKDLFPGKTLDKETLQRLFGKQLKFTELMHQDTENKFNLANTTLSGHATFEKSVLALRKEIPAEELKTELNIALDTSGDSPKDESDGSVPANVYELLGLRKLYEGSPRLYSWVLYVTAGAVAMITLFFIILNLL